ncbi:hypothetical protein HZS_1589 [Henneguya salminicola]|nr:hypothetical protein HZS_1589 [Henneguya salminicola]
MLSLLYPSWFKDVITLSIKVWSQALNLRNPFKFELKLSAFYDIKGPYIGYTEFLLNCFQDRSRRTFITGGSNTQ